MKPNKIRDFFLAALFIAGFLFVGSGMLEALIFGILERLGL